MQSLQYTGHDASDTKNGQRTPERRCAHRVFVYVTVVGVLRMAPKEPLVLEAQAQALHSSSKAFAHLANGQARSPENGSKGTPGSGGTS